MRGVYDVSKYVHDVTIFCRVFTDLNIGAQGCEFLTRKKGPITTFSNLRYEPYFFAFRLEWYEKARTFFPCCAGLATSCNLVVSWTVLFFRIKSNARCQQSR